MPPALSDAESDDLEIPDVIPAKGKAKAEPEAEVKEGEDEDEDEDDDEVAEDEYRVEKILAHDFRRGVVLYQIKWLGWDKAEDLTWEPEENLEGAKDILAEYHEKIGGPPEPPTKGSTKKGSAAKSKGKRSAADAFDSPAPTSGKRGRKSNGVAAEYTTGEAKRTLPPGSWEDQVLCVTSVIEESIPVKGARGTQTEERVLVGLLQWKDGGPKTQHKMKVLRQKVPQKLLDYYEQHLVFTKPEDEDMPDTLSGA